VTALSPEDVTRHREPLDALARDPRPEIRAAVAEKLAFGGSEAMRTLGFLESDTEAVVREAVATAYGELGTRSVLGWLIDAAREDPDRGVREAAVAALGAIGDDDAIEPLLTMVAEGPPQVRRRAIAAITVFDDPRIEPAITRAAFDRNPSVREAAEMVVGRQLG
jgi:HEAT repeat protein